MIASRTRLQTKRAMTQTNEVFSACNNSLDDIVHMQKKAKVDDEKPVEDAPVAAAASSKAEEEKPAEDAQNKTLSFEYAKGTSDEVLFGWLEEASKHTGRVIVDINSPETTIGDVTGPLRSQSVFTSSRRLFKLRIYANRATGYDILVFVNGVITQKWVHVIELEFDICHFTRSARFEDEFEDIRLETGAKFSLDLDEDGYCSGRVRGCLDSEDFDKYCQLKRK